MAPFRKISRKAHPRANDEVAPKAHRFPSTAQARRAARRLRGQSSAVRSCWRFPNVGAGEVEPLDHRIELAREGGIALLASQELGLRERRVVQPAALACGLARLDHPAKTMRQE